MPENVGSSRSDYLSSIVALVLGGLLAVGVTALFQAFGWGGEYASQIAGAMSGAAPLIVDGLRRRRSRGPRQDLVTLSKGRAVGSQLIIAAVFAFALLAIESTFSVIVTSSTRATISLAHGDQDRFGFAYLALGATLVLPLTLAATVLLALAAGHRLGDHRKRWLLFGMVIYLIVRAVNILLSGADTGIVGVNRARLVVGLAVSWPIMVAFVMIGAAWARRTQEVFNATAFFRRLPDEDKQATLALLGETVAARDTRPPVGEHPGRPVGEHPARPVGEQPGYR